MQIELYCDNHMCDVREFVILAKRTSALHQTRADVRALHAIDMGTIQDQRDSGYELTFDARGRVSSRSASFGDLDDPVTHNAKVLARRSRQTQIVVEPDS
jgi:hypothetical protein